MPQTKTQTIEETTFLTPNEQQVITKTRVITPREGADYRTKKAIFRTYQILWFVLGIVEVALGFRILLKLLGANSQSEFTSFIYSISDPLALPFAGIFGVTNISDMLFEWSSLIAMAVYVILAYGIISLFQIVTPTTPEEVDQTIDNQ